jgi:chromosome segregation and condensation protein ScpB
MALQQQRKKNEMKRDLSQAACGVLAGVSLECQPTMSGEIEARVKTMAKFVAVGRAFVARNRLHEVIDLPEPEGPMRVAQQLVKLGQGLALINGRTKLADDDVRILGRVARDSIPAMRAKVLAEIAREEPITLGKLALALRVQEGSIRYILDDLWVLGLLTKKRPKGDLQFKYRIADTWKAIVHENL